MKNKNNHPNLNTIKWLENKREEIIEHRRGCESWRKLPPDVCVFCVVGSISKIIDPTIRMLKNEK